MLWTFWENCQFQLRSTSKFIILAASNQIQLFCRTQVFFYSQSFERFERSYSFSCIVQQNWNIWTSLKNSMLFSENPSFLWRNAHFLKVLRKFTVSVALDIKFANLSCFQKFRFLFRKNHLFLEPKLSSNPTNSVNFAASLLPLAI